MINKINNFGPFTMPYIAPQNTKAKESKGNNKVSKGDVFMSGSLALTGGITGVITDKIANHVKAEEALKKYKALNDAIWDFATSPEGIEKVSIQGAKTNPYEYLTTWMERIRYAKDPRTHIMPNCLLFVSKDRKKSEDLIDWFANFSMGEYIKHDAWNMDNGILDLLEKAEGNFQTTNRWNVIYMKDMDKLINPKEVDRGCIASMKAIMCSCAEDNHATMLFQTQHINELDDAAIATNRVNSIFDIDSMTHLDKYKRMVQEQYKQECRYYDYILKNKKFPSKAGLIGVIAGIGVSIAILTIKNMKKRKKNEDSK